MFGSYKHFFKIEINNFQGDLADTSAHTKSSHLSVKHLNKLVFHQVL